MHGLGEQTEFLVILESLTSSEDFTWVNKEQAISVDGIFVEESKGKAQLWGGFRIKF